MIAARRAHRGNYRRVFLKGGTRWQVSYYNRSGKKEIAQVLIDDTDGRVLETWTGYQVAWSMARGYPGAFGRRINALIVWLPLCALFLLPFLGRRRRGLGIAHLDLLVLVSFSVSLAFFNHGDIGMSVPLCYPPLLYLLGRMLWIGFTGRRGPPLTLHAPVAWAGIGLLFLVGFRVGLNLANSNVIDVGYAGVIGAHKILHGQQLFGAFPTDNQHGDTYGPLTYLAYIPAVVIFGWSGRWDDLPAAHATAIGFDLLALLGLWLLGRRLAGPALGVTLAWAWAAFPFTAYSLESNSNDSLVPALLVLALLVVGARPAARGAAVALAGMAKFAPLGVGPVLARRPDDGRLDPARARALRARRRARARRACSSPCSSGGAACTRCTTAPSPTRPTAARRSRSGACTAGPACSTSSRPARRSAAWRCCVVPRRRESAAPPPWPPPR